MTFQSRLPDLPKADLAAYGVARAKDAAFDAIRRLWERRKAEGLKQKDLAEIIGRDAGSVSRYLSGPANWTFRTFGELAVGLGGEIEIQVHALEDPLDPAPNFDAYDGYVRTFSSPQTAALRVSPLNA
jgi:transcriptional regulator with XRE-family HTH domain